VFENRALRITSQEEDEVCVMESFIISALYKILG
jgi:hypothetical protein